MTDIVYPIDSEGNVREIFRDEARCMSDAGFNIVASADEATNPFIFRSCMMTDLSRYPSSPLGINNAESYRKTLYISEYLDCIRDLTFPTFIIDELDPEAVTAIICRAAWEKAFIKQDAKSLFAVSDEASVWPDTSIEKMRDTYREWNLTGPFAIRKFIDNPQIFYDEQRYWVLDGRAFHPSGCVPDFVSDAAVRVYRFSGSRYFTVDVAGEYIVEINPGESSDRGGENPAEFIASIFARTFLHT